MSKPTHIAYVVVDNGADKKATWHRVAAGWQHKNDPGLDLTIPPGVTLSGRIVIMPRKEDEAEPTA